MRHPDYHIVRTASVNFRYNGNADGLALQHEVAGWCREHLGPALHSALREYDRDEAILYIDQIRLDINLDETRNWQQDLNEKIIHELKEVILAKITTGTGESGVKSSSASFAETLLYFLKFGILPWNSGLKSAGDFNTELKEWINTAPSSEMIALYIRLRENRPLRRLVNILGQEDFEIFANAILNESRERISAIFRDILALAGQFSDDRGKQKSYVNEYKVMLLTGMATAHSESHLKITLKKWLEKSAAEHPLLLQKIDLAGINDSEIKTIIRTIKTPSKKGKAKVTDIPDKPGPGTELQAELKKGVFINNAGAVIIAPFLPALFSTTGIAIDNEINDHSAAMAILHYCISGNVPAAEFELLLPKVLCGIEPAAAIEMPSQIDEKLIVEADEMLKSVIGHWSVLGDTSIGGLREAFLQREGKLVHSGEEWILYPEQKSYDMLLDHLPWSIRMIKLPWMNDMLKTEWI